MFKYHPTDEEGGPEFEVDFTPPFRRVSMIRELEKKLGVTFPHPSEFDTVGWFSCSICDEVSCNLISISDMYSYVAV